ncbi:cellulase family glycosylhydrolase [Candidatus Saccharibacteria bacterium]|nr:cellulase family glycosylhydrolase [Candidatus Saccharibacteria bacterium]
MALAFMAGSLAGSVHIAQGAEAQPDTKPGLQYVGVDIDVRSPDSEQVSKELDRAKELGYNALRLVTTWSFGQAEAYNDVPMLEFAIREARERDMEPILAVTPCWQSENCEAPTASDQTRFITTLSHLAQVLDVKQWIIGIEPNNSIFWNFQYAQNGESRAPAAYYRLVARSYDELKKRSPDNVVICGSLASSGDDDPTKKRPGHSIYRFIEGMAAEYKKSGRQSPFCDVLAIHPHLAFPTESPLTEHGQRTVGIADYPKLVKLWDKAFKDTGQPKVPIFYSEFGIESEIPKSKLAFYTGSQSERLKESVRAEYLNQAYKVAACQVRVIGLNNFLLYDEQRLDGWQSGAYYADGSPKSSLDSNRRTITETKSGTMNSSC